MTRRNLQLGPRARVAGLEEPVVDLPAKPLKRKKKRKRKKKKEAKKYNKHNPRKRSQAYETASPKEEIILPNKPVNHRADPEDPIIYIFDLDDGNDDET